MSSYASTAVLLAAGRGTRMQRVDDSARLSEAQQRVANAGLKTLIPDAKGRPFLLHIMARLGEAGIDRVVIVVAPEHEAIEAAIAELPPAANLNIEVVVQHSPRGTADALLAAAERVGDESFLVLNSDNLYPNEAIAALCTLGEPGLVAFDAAALVSAGNIEPERVQSFALLEIDADGYLTRLIEKPDPETTRAMAGSPVSMNLWRFDGAIFDACRRVQPSSRGELELPEAVAQSIADGRRYRAVPLAAGVLDLSNRGDVMGVAALLGAQELWR